MIGLITLIYSCYQRGRNINGEEYKMIERDSAVIYRDCVKTSGAKQQTKERQPFFYMDFCKQTPVNFCKNINNKRKNKYNKCVLKCVYSQEEEKKFFFSFFLLLK